MQPFEEPKPTSEGMRQGLARMYGDTFMREYLVNAIAIYKAQALKLLGDHKDEEARDSYSRARAYEVLLANGKQHFVHFEDIKKKLKNPLEGLVDKRDKTKNNVV